MSSLLSFVQRWRGQVCNVPGGAGGQCVDLANQYLQDVWKANPRRLNAVDWSRTVLPGMTWTPNSPTNTPPAYALVVWGKNAKDEIGPFGHIAVAIYGEVMQFLSFDQNWPSGAPCALVVHDYNGVLGWHRPSG